MLEYVCGFMFSPDNLKVLLIRKARPKWQMGKWNGVGGRVKEGESTYEAMVREFKEETDIDTVQEDWKKVAILDKQKWLVYFFAAKVREESDWFGGPVKHRLPILASDALLPDEPVEWCDVKSPPTDCIPNLRWLIPFCLEETAEFPIRVRTLQGREHG